MATGVGADGCRGGGWVAAVVTPDGGLRWDWADDTAALLQLADALDADAVAVDVPIGLPALGATRACDDLARRRLGARRSSVFAAPPREVLACATYAQARPLAPSLSAQAFGLVPRIREVVFALLAEGAPLAAKKTAAGVLQRVALLEGALGRRLPTDVPPGAALDDALDAAACAVTALRWAGGQAEVLGAGADAEDVPMRIVV